MSIECVVQHVGPRIAPLQTARWVGDVRAELAAGARGPGTQLRLFKKEMGRRSSSSRTRRESHRVHQHSDPEVELDDYYDAARPFAKVGH